MGNCCNTGADEPERLRLHAISTSVALVAVLSGWLLPHAGLPALALPALLVAYAAGGWQTAGQAFRALRCGDLDVDLLMLLAAVGAASVGHWLEGAVLLFLFSFGNTLETFAFGRTRRSIEALVELRPESAARVRDGQEQVVPIAQLSLGDIVRVRPGDRIPVDGTVVTGTSSVDESTLTGESIPVRKEIDKAVFAGTLNGHGSLDIQMTRPASESELARIIRLVEEARDSKAPTQSWIEDVEGRYAFAVIVAAGAAIFIPWLLLGWTFEESFYRAMTLMVVASPCALVISIPATIVSAVSNGARHGILFKGGVHLDNLSSVTTFALDKTGTITVGRPEVVAITSFRSIEVGTGADTNDAETRWQGSTDKSVGQHDRLLALAAAAESRSEHHLADAILRAADERELILPEPSSFVSIPGDGVEAMVGADKVEVGRRSWIEERVGHSLKEHPNEGFDAEHAATTRVHVAINGVHEGAFAIHDHPRSGTRAAIEALTLTGITRTVMLTGDTRSTAEDVGAQVGIDEVYAELRPDDKSRILATLRTDGLVAMVGDGVNDAPALASADVGIAIGVAGTDVALETADIVVMGEDLGSLARAVRLSHRTRKIVRQNLIFSVGVMGTLVVAALMGWIGLTAGVIGHEGSTIIVVFNGLRLLADERNGS